VAQENPVLESSWAEEDLEYFWNSVDRALLKVGKAGFQATHTNSLQELLRHHPLVKVQMNAAIDDVAIVAECVAHTAGARYIKQKGRTLLFVSGKCMHSNRELAWHGAYTFTPPAAHRLPCIRTAS
jgi:RNA-binding protein YhbY